MLRDTVRNRPTYDESVTRLKSYVGWCVEVASPAFILSTEDQHDVGSSKSPEEWRHAGTQCFKKGDYHEAEKVYLKGVMALSASTRETSQILNYISAVHLLLFRDTLVVAGGSPSSNNEPPKLANKVIPSAEAALLNCSVAAIIDPLNFQAWVRRVRCLQKLGFTPQECIADLHTIQASVSTKKAASPATALRVEEFKHSIKTEIKRLTKLCADTNAVTDISEVSTEEQRKKRDNMMKSLVFPDDGEPAQDTDSPTTHEYIPGRNGELPLDDYIASLERFLIAMESSMPLSDSERAKKMKKLPPEFVMCLDHAPPPFHLEYPKLRGWPNGIDPKFARKVLYSGYLHGRSSPWIVAERVRNGTFFTDLQPEQLGIRWHGTGNMFALSKKAGSARFGDVFDGREVIEGPPPMYDSHIRSNFANNPNRCEVFFFGTTHVAVGFNDLSSLLTASLQEKSADATGPLRFVGFEMSEFSVTKSRVIAKMLQSPNVALTSVMEVWLSSTWTEAALEDFRKSVNMVLASLEVNENKKVESYLRFWASTDTISAAKAHSEFLAIQENYNKRTIAEVCTLQREIDRLDLVQYILTGEIRASPHVLQRVDLEESACSKPHNGTQSASKKKKKKRNRKKSIQNDAEPEDLPVVGSVTMWNAPPGAPPLEIDVAFNIVSFADILEDYISREKSQKGIVDRLSFADLFMINILRNLKRLRDLMLSDRLTIEVMYGVLKAVRSEEPVDAENEELLGRIASMRPYTISWSNVLDYFLPKDFHDLARRCSVHGDCVHYGYSMNWPSQVLGASIIDYSPEDHQDIIEDVLNASIGFPTKTGATYPGSVEVHKSFGLEKLVTLPYHDDPINVTSFVLANAYKECWVKHFMKNGEISKAAERRLGAACTRANRGLQQGSMQLSIPSPLYRTPSSLYMSWCYDPDLHLEAAPNMYEIPSDPRNLLMKIRRQQQGF